MNDDLLFYDADANPVLKPHNPSYCNDNIQCGRQSWVYYFLLFIYDPLSSPLLKYLKETLWLSQKTVREY